MRCGAPSAEPPLFMLGEKDWRINRSRLAGSRLLFLSVKRAVAIRMTGTGAGAGQLGQVAIPSHPSGVLHLCCNLRTIPYHT